MKFHDCGPEIKFELCLTNLRTKMGVRPPNSTSQIHFYISVIRIYPCKSINTFYNDFKEFEKIH